MIPKAFHYFAPDSVAGARSLLKKYGEDAKVLAGGQSLIPMMKLRLATPQYVVDINNIRSLSYIEEADNHLVIGALVRHADVLNSELARSRLPLLVECASQVADFQIRNLGTIVGALTHADPAGDWCAAALALDGELVIEGEETRNVKVSDFFVGPFTTALNAGELVTKLKLPIPKERQGWAYVKFERKAGDLATAAAAVEATVAQGAVKMMRIALCAAGPVPMRVRSAEGLLEGRMPTDGDLKMAAKEASEEAQPIQDLRGSAEYKKAMFKVVTYRALRLALERARFPGGLT